MKDSRPILSLNWLSRSRIWSIFRRLDETWNTAMQSMPTSNSGYYFVYCWAKWSWLPNLHWFQATWTDWCTVVLLTGKVFLVTRADMASGVLLTQSLRICIRWVYHVCPRSVSSRVLNFWWSESSNLILEELQRFGVKSRNSKCFYEYLRSRYTNEMYPHQHTHIHFSTRASHPK